MDNIQASGTQCAIVGRLSTVFCVHFGGSIIHCHWYLSHHASCDVSGNGYPQVPREQSLCVLDGLSERSSVCVLCDEDEDLALFVEDANELEDVGMIQTL